MKLVKRKTQKAIEKSIQKAFKKHGPKLVAALAGSIATAVAALASTESPQESGKSNLGAMVDKAKDAVTGTRKKGGRLARREHSPRRAAELEDAQSSDTGSEVQPQLT